MAIEYDDNRKAYVDSDNGEYITFEQGDRESCLYYYYLHDAEGNFQIGALIQRYVAEFIGDLDNATHWQYIVITAWQPNTSLPKNREILEETDPRIQRLGEFFLHAIGGRENRKKVSDWNSLSIIMEKKL